MPHINRRIPDLGHKKKLPKEKVEDYKINPWQALFRPPHLSNDPKVRAGGKHTGHKYGPVNLSWKGPNTKFWSGVPGYLMGLPSQEQIDKATALRGKKKLDASKISKIPSTFDQAFSQNAAKGNEFTYTQEMLKAQEARQVENERLTKAYQQKQADESGGNPWAASAFTGRELFKGHAGLDGKVVVTEADALAKDLQKVNDSNTPSHTSEIQDQSNKVVEPEVKKRERHISSVPSTSRNSIRKMRKELEERFPNLDKKRQEEEEKEKIEPPKQTPEGDKKDKGDKDTNDKEGLTAEQGLEMVQNLANALAKLEGKPVSARNTTTDVDLFGGYA